MAVQVRELGPWDGSTALLLDGGDGPPARPPVHLQAAMGGYLRLVGPDGPLVWGKGDSYGVEIVRAPGARLHVIPPIRADQADQAPGVSGSPEFDGWWTRWFAERLRESPATPLAPGRRALLAPGNPLATIWRLDELLDELRDQRGDFELDWDHPALLLVRELSDAGDGRVKMWRKRVRDRTLPPVLVWWCRGLFTSVVLDGHDRVHAALLEDTLPDVIVLADVTPRASDALEQDRQEALDLATTVGSRSVAGLAAATNTVLGADWDPRVAWRRGTPGFPLEGGVSRWQDEVRGTSLDRA